MEFNFKKIVRDVPIKSLLDYKRAIYGNWQVLCVYPFLISFFLMNKNLQADMQLERQSPLNALIFSEKNHIKRW